ncbi:hypothetical protein ACJIZ3_001270 [Penstemon smallii]|uniref:PXMP2/4 family protein 4 n=1 Tax=Penstemon smallii TaxID=265156 RepID=A0ABD3U482_9LAMI
MAAALTKTHRHSHSLKYLFTNRSKHSITDPLLAPKDFPAHQLIQCKWRSRFPQTNFKKTKALDISSPNIISSSPKFGLVGWYLGLVKTRPVATKSITSALIYTAADVSSQTIMGETSERYDLLRTLRMAGYGMLIIGPSLHYWFNFMSRVFPKRDLLSTFKKITLGQTVYGPAMNVIFFSMNAALQGENGSEIVARLKRDLVPTMISGIMYWPVCDFVTFKFIPVHLQPLVSNSFSYLWTVYMTYMVNLEKVGTS